MLWRGVEEWLWNEFFIGQAVLVVFTLERWCFLLFRGVSGLEFADRALVAWLDLLVVENGGRRHQTIAEPSQLRFKLLVVWHQVRWGACLEKGGARFGVIVIIRLCREDTAWEPDLLRGHLLKIDLAEDVVGIGSCSHSWDNISFDRRCNKGARSIIEAVRIICPSGLHHYTFLTHHLFLLTFIHDSYPSPLNTLIQKQHLLLRLLSLQTALIIIRSGLATQSVLLKLHIFNGNKQVILLFCINFFQFLK